MTGTRNAGSGVGSALRSGTALQSGSFASDPFAAARRGMIQNQQNYQRDVFNSFGNINANFQPGFANRLFNGLVAANNLGLVQRNLFNEGTRSNAVQQGYYDRYKAGVGGIAAPPGASNHQYGLAVDTNRGPIRNYLRENASILGLGVRPQGLDQPHVEMGDYGGALGIYGAPSKPRRTVADDIRLGSKQMPGGGFGATPDRVANIGSQPNAYDQRPASLASIDMAMQPSARPVPMGGAPTGAPPQQLADLRDFAQLARREFAPSLPARPHTPTPISARSMPQPVMANSSAAPPSAPSDFVPGLNTLERRMFPTAVDYARQQINFDGPYARPKPSSQFAGNMVGPGAFGSQDPTTARMLSQAQVIANNPGYAQPRLTTGEYGAAPSRQFAGNQVDPSAFGSLAPRPAPPLDGRYGIADVAGSSYPGRRVAPPMSPPQAQQMAQLNAPQKIIPDGVGAPRTILPDSFGGPLSITPPGFYGPAKRQPGTRTKQPGQQGRDTRFASASRTPNNQARTPAPQAPPLPSIPRESNWPELALMRRPYTNPYSSRATYADIRSMPPSVRPSSNPADVYDTVQAALPVPVNRFDHFEIIRQRNHLLRRQGVSA